MKNRIPMKDDWETPKDFLKELELEFGKMFDPCPLNSKFDGLKICWKKVNFINPPYSRKLKEAFILKAFEESKKHQQKYFMKSFIQMQRLDLLEED